VTSHSPLSTKKIFRADEGCQSLDQPAGARMKPNCVAGAKEERSRGGAGGAAIPIVGQLPLPHLRLRQVTTSAIVWDGQTVVLGGLISENVTKTKDKVPMLGDLPFVGRLRSIASGFR